MPRRRQELNQSRRTSEIDQHQDTQRSPKSTRRIEAILEAAKAVFEEDGYEQATVAKIAERIDVVEGTVFAYFSSKRALMLAVIEQFYEEVTHRLENGVLFVSGARNQLGCVIRNHLGIVLENSELCSVILRESRGLEKPFAAEVQAYNRRYTSIVGKIIKSGIDEGELKPSTSPVLVRNAIFGTIEHYLWDLVDGSHSFDQIEVGEQVTTLIYDGIAAGSDTVNRRDVNQLVRKLNRLL